MIDMFNTRNFRVVCLAVFAIGCGHDNAANKETPVDGGRKVSPADEPGERVAKSITNSIGMKLVLIPPGEFLMGSAESDPDARDDEKPQHQVRITKPFYLGAYEVTQGEFEQVMGKNPSVFSNTGPFKDRLAGLKTLRFPVENAPWYSVVEFCRRLSESAAEKQAGRVYRLPTEAEWEYACRAGTTSPFHFGTTLSSAQANFDNRHPLGDAEKGGFLNRTTEVGSYAPNAFGLYDMHGNLNEWCADRFDRDYYKVSPTDNPTGPETGTSRVIRGGDWYLEARSCRSAFRYADIPDGIFYAIGFRVVCERATDATPDTLLPPVPTIVTQPKPTTSTTSNATAKRPEPTSGEDWPRWRGPRADGTWNAPKLVEKWPEAGLQQIWRKEIGGGYGGVSVSNGKVYVMDRQQKPEELERVLCFDAVTGKLLWSHPYPVDYHNVAYGNGPRATPTVFDGYVYSFGALGHLNCLEADKGEIVWSNDLVRDFNAKVPIWGVSASPLVFEELLIVHAGVQPDGCYIAFDRRSGEERWRNLPDPAGYATPILINFHDRPQLVCWTPQNVCGLNPQDGKLLWTIPFVVNYGTSVADPIFHEELVLVSSYYDGPKIIRPGREPTEVKLSLKESRNLRALMSQPLYRDGHAYLLDKRHGLTCFELATGRKIWDDDNRMTPKGRNPQATMVWLNDEDRAIVLNSDGELILARLNPQGYSEQSRTKIIGPTWAHPAYSGNCVYARSDTELVCHLLVEAD